MVPTNSLYIGLMSGTSMDGVDGVICRFDAATTPSLALLNSAHIPFPPLLKEALLSLQYPAIDELHQAACLGNDLAELYAQTVTHLLEAAELPAHAITAIGCHGQTIRHNPAAGYTLQIGNPALLAELTGIDVIGDFRSRDIAAGGQGAPLVPAFHLAAFGQTDVHTTVANIGGMANLTRLHPGQPVIGFDCGPGNVLMDAWVHHRRGLAFDQDGAWAASGQVIPDLLTELLAHPYFAKLPPKSCGREEFDFLWLRNIVTPVFLRLRDSDVQATLLELTAQSLTRAVLGSCAQTERLLLCGGGTRNQALVSRISALLPTCFVSTTESAGIPPDLVEASAFAWLAFRHINRLPGNLPDVTGAKGLRILGAHYPA